MSARHGDGMGRSGELAISGGLRARWSLLETFRPDIIADLAMTWRNSDLAQPCQFFLPAAAAPSLTKDALSTGLLAGALARDGGGLRGNLALTAEGRLLVRRMRRRMHFK